MPSTNGAGIADQKQMRPERVLFRSEKEARKPRVEARLESKLCPVTCVDTRVTRVTLRQRVGGILWIEERNQKQMRKLNQKHTRKLKSGTDEKIEIRNRQGS